MNTKTKRRRSVPGYLKHKSGQARTILNGKTHYLGTWGTPESHEAYSRLIRAWEKNERQPIVAVPDAAEAALTVGHLTAEHERWVEATGLYRKLGKPTSAHDRLKKAMESLREFAGTMPLRSFNKQTLTLFRDRLCAATPKTMVGVNKAIQLVKRLVHWGAERGLVADAQAMSISSLKPIREAPRKKPPVPIDHLVQTLETLTLTAPVVADMVRVQFLMGCRPGEVRLMTWADIDRRAVTFDNVRFWTYTVRDGKTQKEVYLVNPEAQAILKNYEKRDGTVPIFTPQDQAQRTGRKLTPPYDAARPYGRCDYRQCVQRAAKRAKVPTFGVHQIRHAALSMIANDARGGIGAASALANHASQATTARFYAAAERRSAAVGSDLLQGRLMLTETTKTGSASHA